jgi:hypothetical protein
LRRTDISQLWWSIRSAHNHRHIALVSFNNSTMKVSGSCSRCAQENCRGVRGKTDTKGSERGASLVVEDMYSNLRARREGNR